MYYFALLIPIVVDYEELAAADEERESEFPREWTCIEPKQSSPCCAFPLVSCASPLASLALSPVTAPRTRSTLPPMRSAVPSTYSCVCASLYSASPEARCSLPDWASEVMPVTLPTVSLMPPTVEFQLALDCGNEGASASRLSEAARPLLYVLTLEGSCTSDMVARVLRVKGKKRKGCRGSPTAGVESSASSNAS